MDGLRVKGGHDRGEGRARENQDGDQQGRRPQGPPEELAGQAARHLPADPAKAGS